MRPTTTFAALLSLVPLLASAVEYIPCNPVDLNAFQWYRETPIDVAHDLQVVYAAEKADKYERHMYTLSASVDLAYNAYIGCKSENGNGRQFAVTFKGAQGNDLGSFWIQKDQDCIISGKIKREDVKSIVSRERNYG